MYFVQSTGALNAEKDTGGVPELALRFDLTVPLARYVAEHERELSFPFRRYQMQRVYRVITSYSIHYTKLYEAGAFSCSTKGQWSNWVTWIR